MLKRVSSESRAYKEWDWETRDSRYGAPELTDMTRGLVFQNDGCYRRSLNVFQHSGPRFHV